MIVSFIFGISLSSATLYLAFRNVPFRELTHYLGSVDYGWVLATVPVVLICFVLRAVRWQVILKTVGRVEFWRAFHPLMIGFMMNCVLPGRVGEVARPAILHRKDRVPFSTGLATVAAERIFDVSLLVALSATVLTGVNFAPDIQVSFGKHTLSRETLVSIGMGLIQLALAVVTGMILISIDRLRSAGIRVFLKTPGLLFWLDDQAREKIRVAWFMPVARVTENIASGLSLVKKPKTIGICLLLSVSIWALSAVSYYLMALGSPGIELSFLEISAVMIIICFFIALPSAPGFWGLWEAGGVFALSLFGVSSSAAAGYTLVNHAVQIFPVIIVGLISALITGVNFWKLGRGEYTSKNPSAASKTVRKMLR